ncbi:UNVERIFIED_CONTAM: hypothetical protein FKN15_062730 [Acipenser sinensis]
MDKKQLRKRYLKGWFTVDLFAIFPFEIVYLTYPKQDIWIMLSYCRLNRILKVVRLFSFIYIGLPPEVQTWVEKYYVYLWKHRKGTIIAGLLDDLPFSIHSEISLACNQILLKKSTLFRGTDEGFKRALSVSINPYTYSAGQILVKRGESNQSMYYLEHGLVQIYLMYKIPRNVTICAATLCEIYVLHQKDLLNLFADFPEGFNNTGFGATLHAIAFLVDLIAVIDIVINLRTQVTSKNGNQSDFKSIYKNYQSTWNLYYDVAAVLPTDLFTFVEEEHLRWPYLGLFRMNRLLWLRKVYLFYVKRENDLEKNLLQYRASKCVFMLMFSIHTCAGLFYLAGCFKQKCDPGSWADKYGFTKYDPDIEHYITAVYWAGTTMTTTGYGDITGSTAIERIICIFVSIIGAFVFNYIVSQIGATLASTNASRVGFQNRLVAMTYFMESHDLSQSLQQRVIQYMSLLWEKYHLMFIRVFKFIVLMSLFVHISAVVFLTMACPQTCHNGWPQLTGEYLAMKGDIGTEMFLILHGKVSVKKFGADHKEVVEHLVHGNSYGTVFLIKRMSFPESVIAENYVDILTLSKDDFVEIGSFYPEVMSKLLKRAVHLYGY